jgi:TM2 domain-containing membrane protein YozV
MGEPVLDLVNCPFCAEEIKPATVKCKHCGEFLGKSKEANRELKTSFNHRDPQIAHKSKGTAFILGLVIPGAGSMYAERIGKGVLFFVGILVGVALGVIPGVILYIISLIACLGDVDAFNLTPPGVDSDQGSITQVKRRSEEKKKISKPRRVGRYQKSS